MQDRIFHRLSFAVLATALLVRGVGCGGDNFFPSEPSNYPDFGDPISGASDQGFSESDAGAGLTMAASLLQPVAWSSLVPLDSKFVFDLTLPQPMQPDALEPGVAIAKRGMLTALGGAFSWRQTGAVNYQLTFIPSAPLTDATDYVVNVTDPTSGTQLVHVGVSTGSHPRVVAVKLHGENQASLVYFDVAFSEPMNQNSFVGRVNVSAGTPAAVVPGTLPSTTPAGVQLRYQLTNGKMLKSPIELRIGVGVQAASGVALDPDSWDALSEGSGGDFAISVPNPNLDTAVLIDLPFFTPVVY